MAYVVMACIVTAPRPGDPAAAVPDVPLEQRRGARGSRARRRAQGCAGARTAHTTITGSPHHYYGQPTPLLQGGELKDVLVRGQIYLRQPFGACRRRNGRGAGVRIGGGGVGEVSFFFNISEHADGEGPRGWVEPEGGVGEKKVSGLQGNFRPTALAVGVLRDLRQKKR